MRQHRLNVRMNERELEAAQRKAQEEGWNTVSDWVRWMALQPVGETEREAREATCLPDHGQNCP